MHGTGPDFNGQGFQSATPQVWPGQSVSSYIGIYAPTLKDEGTYELEMPASSLYDFKWEDQDWNVAKTTVVVSDSMERYSAVQTEYYEYEFLASLCQSCLFTKLLTIKFHNPDPVPTSVPSPSISYVSNEGAGDDPRFGALPEPYDTALQLDSNISGEVTASDSTIPGPDDEPCHCKVYNFNAAGPCKARLSCDWDSYLLLVRISGSSVRTEEILNGIEPNMDLKFEAYGNYYLIVVGYSPTALGTFNLTLERFDNSVRD